MKHLRRLIIVTALLLTLFTVLAPSHPASAAGGCVIASGGTGAATVQLDPTHRYTLNFHVSGPGSSITFSVQLKAGLSQYVIFAGPGSWSIVDNSMDCSNVSFTDGRINKFVRDTNQTAAIYCLPSRIEIYSTTGQFLFRITHGEINRLTPQSTPQLIKQKNGIRVYLLSTGQLQLNAPPLEQGKPDYSFTFTNCT